MEMIENNLELPWFWEFISFNPNLTIDFIERHKHRKFNWMNISRNYLKNCSTLRLIKQKTISKWWKKKFYFKKLKRLVILKKIMNEKLKGNKDVIILIINYLC